jgi:FAD:protein FMN transferase
MPRKRTPCATALSMALVCACLGCDRGSPEPAPTPAGSALPDAPVKVDFREKAMGTEIRIVAYTSPRASEAATRTALRRAHAEMVRLENLMTTWREDSELAELNRRSGELIGVSPDSLAVLEKSIWAAKISEGTFDVTYASMGPLWKFGDAAEPDPKPPSADEIARGIARIDWRKIEIDRAGSRARIGAGQRVDLGGIAKGYAVDRAAAVLHQAGLSSFLVQAGGDLFGAGRKPDGSPWVSGVRDPRGPPDRFFATIELENHAFSTAGDYARSFMRDGKRYHHIIDPRTGYPATASRSVTVWAPDALTADALDDAVFILGPEKGLALVESQEGVGAVIVDSRNQVHVSQRLRSRLKITSAPTDAP